MDIYKKIPGQMVTGVVDNFKKTFNKNNFLNYWNPNTSYKELKDYSKSVIQTGATIYGGVKVIQAVWKPVSEFFKNIQEQNSVTTEMLDTNEIKALPSANNESIGIENDKLNLSKSQILKNNRINGKLAEDRARIDLNNKYGEENVYSQVSIRTEKGLRRMDFVVQTKESKWLGIEVKSGNATRTVSQLMKDKIISTSGGKFVGKKAPYYLKAFDKYKMNINVIRY